MSLLAFLAAQALPVAPPAPPPLRVVASVELERDPAIRAEFLLLDDLGFIRVVQGEGWSPPQQIADPATALRLLSDRRLALLWPFITEWAGPDLVRLRDQRLARARRGFEMAEAAMAPRGTAESAGTRRNAALLQYADALRGAGDPDAARDLLDRTRATLSRDTDPGRADWTMITTRMGTHTTVSGELDRSIALFTQAREMLPQGSNYVLNFDVNRAALLAELGRHAEALALVDQAEAVFNKTRERDGGDRVPGSDRQFAWIRACALHGLGRLDEAKRAMRPVLDMREPRDPQFVLLNNSSVRFRLFRCIGDAPAAAAQFAAEFGEVEIAPSALTWMQPGAGRSRHAAFYAAVAREPVLAPLLAERMRVLPPELQPALKEWQPPR